MASEGYDIPPYAGLLDFKVWETVEPPLGTVYNYPMRPWHNTLPSLAASEAPPDIAVQIYRPRHPQSDHGAAEAGPDDSAGDRLGAGGTGGLRPLNRCMRKLAQGWRCTLRRQPLAWPESNNNSP